MLPTLIGLISNQDQLFSGFSSTSDGNTYLSFMNQARGGKFFFTNMYTSENVPYAMFRPIYLIAGWIALLTNLPNIIIYHFFRLIGIILFIYFLQALIKLFFKKEKEQLITLFICIFASGFGYFLKLLTYLGIKQYGSVDLSVTGVNNFLILFNHPHTIFSIAFMTATIYYLIKWNENLDFNSIIISAFFALFLGFEHLFDVITIYLLIFFLIFIKIIESKKINKKKILHLLIFGIITSIPFLYTLIIFTIFPEFKSWNVQNVLPTPNILHVIFGNGLMFISFVGFLLVNIKKSTLFKIEPKLRLLILWIFLTFLLIYSPFNIQRRFIEGVHIPFGIITGIFIFTILYDFLIKIINKKLVTFVIIILLLLMIPTNIYHLYIRFDNLNNGRGYFPYLVNNYLYPEEHEALLWLAENSNENEIVFSTYNIGNYIPSYMNNRVYLGHWAQTINFEKKSQEVIDFYKGNPVELNNIDYIWYGIEEKRLNNNLVPPENSDIVFNNEKVTIFKLK